MTKRQAHPKTLSAPEIQASEHSWSGFTLREINVRATPGTALLGPRSERMRVTLVLESEGGFAYCREQSPPRAAPARVARPICLKPAGMQSWLCSDTGGLFRAITLSFEPGVLESASLASADVRALTVPRMMFANDRLWQFGLDLANEWRAPREFSPLYCDHIAMLMLLELLRDTTGREHHSARKGGLTRAQLARVLECIERSPDAPIRLSELAALTGLSMSHFSVAFKRSTGMPPHRWQLNARVSKAKQLLRRRELQITEIAKLTGFVDQSHFTRTFRQFVGLTPMAWRREMLGD